MFFGLVLTALAQFTAWRLQLTIDQSLTFNEATLPMTQPTRIYIQDEALRNNLDFQYQQSELCPGAEVKIAFKDGLSTEVVDLVCYTVKNMTSEATINLTPTSTEIHTLGASQPRMDGKILWFFLDSEQQMQFGRVDGELTNQQKISPVRMCTQGDILSGNNKCQEVTKDAIVSVEYINGATFLDTGSNYAGF
jgi:hypothetical protein